MSLSLSFHAPRCAWDELHVCSLGMGITPHCGSAPATVLRVSLGQHLAQQGAKSCSRMLRALLCQPLSRGTAKGFSLPLLFCSCGRSWSSLLPWMCRLSHTPPTGTCQPQAVPYAAGWVCFVSILSPRCCELWGWGELPQGWMFPRPCCGTGDAQVTPCCSAVLDELPQSPCCCGSFTRVLRAPAGTGAPGRHRERQGLV